MLRAQLEIKEFFHPSLVGGWTAHDELLGSGSRNVKFEIAFLNYRGEFRQKRSDNGEFKVLKDYAYGK